MASESILEIEIKNASVIIDEKTLRKMMETGDSPFLGLCDYIKDNRSNDKWGRKLNIAVIGNSGAGKSSLVNALRNLKPFDEGAAQVGVTQTTQAEKGYTFPENSRVMLSDIPGIGTNAFKREHYRWEVNLDKFDMFIIVTSTRFTENDLYLAGIAAELNRNVLFVRTKIDMDLMNAKRDSREEEFDEDVCIETMKDEIVKELETAKLRNVNRGIFLVSSPERTKYDFPKLMKMLKMMLTKRSEAIPIVLENIANDVMQTVSDSLKEDMRTESNSSYYAGFFAIPTMEGKKMAKKVGDFQDKCLHMFSLDAPSMKKAFMEIGIPVRSRFPLDAEKLYEDTVKANLSHFQQYAKYYVPLLGSTISGSNASNIFEKCCIQFFTDMEKEGTTLIKQRIQRLKEELKAYSKI